MRGVDISLKENLASAFKLDDVERVQVIMCVADADDPAIAVAQRVIKDYPHVDSRLIVGGSEVGVNPKINNILPGYQQAKHDLVWICDSNIHLDPDTLQHASKHMLDPTVGLVHHLPEGVCPKSLGAGLEEMFLNGAHAKVYIVINWLAVDSCVVGKSTMFRKSDLDTVGGLGAFGIYLAEDNMIAQAIMQQGLKHVLSTKTAKQPLVNTSLMEYYMRRSRWGRIRTFSMPLITLVEPYTEALVCGLVGVFAMSRLFYSLNLYIFYASHIIAWIVSDILLYRGVSQHWIQNIGEYLEKWILRELSALPIYLYALWGGRTVEWRGLTYSLNFGGTVDLVSGNGRLSPVLAEQMSWHERVSTYIFARPPLSPVMMSQTRKR